MREVRGRHEGDFEAAIRDGWLGILAKDEDARLLWFCHHVHGNGPAYNVVTVTVTVTAVRDGAPWCDLERDAAVPWSPLQEVDLDSVPTTAQDHSPVLYMEDTGWPHTSLVEYVDFWGAGVFMHEALANRDTWRSRLLRSAPWSPL